MKFLVLVLSSLLLVACGGGDESAISAASPHKNATTALVEPDNGWWWNPAESGRGYSIERQGNQIFMAAYLYETNGAATWYVSGLTRQSSGTYSGTMQRYSGGQTLVGSYKPPASNTSVVANALLSFNTASTGSLTITFADGSPNRTITIERFAFAAFAPSNGSFDNGWWWNEAESGRGYFIEAQGSVAFIGSYMFDSTGQPTWYVSGATLQGTQSLNGLLDQYTHGQSLGGSFKAPTKVASAGTMAFNFTSRTTANMVLPNGRSVALKRFIFNAPTAGVDFTSLSGATSAVISKQKDATGLVIDNKKVVSGEYLVQIGGADSTQGSIRVNIPIEASLLPTGWTPVSFIPEYFDPVTSTWIKTGSFIIYDSTSPTLSFNVNVVNNDLVSTNKSVTAMVHRLGVGRWTYERLYRASIWATDTGNRAVRQIAGSNFIFHYYEPGRDATHSVPANWNGVDAGYTATGATQAPSYIRNLDDALNRAYSELILLSDSQGNKLMPAITVPQHVYVSNLGGDSGNSPPGGPLSMSTRDIDDLEEMRNVAVHELIHVFQGYYINIAVAGSKQWFLEAMANYYAALVNNLNNAQKLNWYMGGFGTDYLSVSIDTNDDQNHYSLAYFLDWLSTNYGNTAIVGDMFTDLNVTASPLLSMDRVLESNGEAKGISGAYDKYMLDFLTHPDGFGGFNRTHKSRMAGYTQGANILTSNNLNSKVTFTTLNRALPPLSSTYLWLNLANPLNALLVIDSSKSETAPNVIKSYLYDFAGINDQAYNGKNATDSGLAFPYVAANQLAIKNFKEMEQLFVNSSALVDGKSYGLNVDYYMLVKPLVKQVQTNAVLWDSSSVGNIPPEYIKGYDVYKDVAGKYTKINSVLKGRIPYVAGGTEIALACTLQDCNDTIKPTDTIVVVIEDKYGNKWPDITVSLPLPTITSLSPTAGAPGATVTITGTGFGTMQGTSKVSFNGTLATIIAWSDKLITAIFPAGATPGPMIVMANGVQSNEVIFTVSGACINDSPTGLCWDTTASSPMNWTDAGIYCSGKGTRLPTIAELISFATSGEIRQDPGKEGVYLYGSLRNLIPPLVARGFIFNVAASWSSTTTVDLANYARFVTFSLGTVGSYSKGQLNYARCVR